jgi:hypothetical protein
MARMSVTGRSHGVAGRVLPGQQDVEEHAECIDVGRSRHLRARQLFGRGEGRRQDRSGFSRERLRVRTAVAIPSRVVIEQLGDPEV